MDFQFDADSAIKAVGIVKDFLTAVGTGVIIWGSVKEKKQTSPISTTYNTVNIGNLTINPPEIKSIIDVSSLTKSKKAITTSQRKSLRRNKKRNS